MTTESAARLLVPLVAGVSVDTTEVAIFSSSQNLPTSVEVLVAYWNGGA